jgi:DNA-binding transcriptional MerR regulator
MATTTTLTISDAARASGVSAHTLRYYERAGLLDPVDRATSGHSHEARLELLEAHREAVRAHLAETERNLELIDYKIDYYRERLAETR